MPATKPFLFTVAEKRSKLECYKAEKVLKHLEEFRGEIASPPLSAPQNDAERELNICQLAELRCRQAGRQSVDKVWKYFVLDLDGDFPWIEEEDKPSAFPPGYHPEANFLSEMERIRIAYQLGPQDVRDAIMAHLAGLKTEFDS